MSFPKLILSGDVATRRISGIGISFGTQTGTTGVYLQRLKHSVKRVYTKGNVNAGTAPAKKAVPYDRFRLVHTFIGFVDVLTQSVVRSDISTPQEITNCDLIESAVIYDDTYISFDYKYFDETSIGASNPSNGDRFEQGLATAPTWTYNLNPTPVEVAVWLIKDIDVVDNQNNTSRVTFAFEGVQSELDLTTLILGA